VDEAYDTNYSWENLRINQVVETGQKIQRQTA
jgi:hypothetical protein